MTVAPKKASYNLEEVMKEVAERNGKNTMRPGSVIPNFLHIPTGVFTLDMALFGGVPETLITQLFGWESSGKTTIAMRVAGNAQKKYPNRKVVFIDAEGTFSPQWALRHGVNLEQLIIVQPESGEQALDIADACIRANDTSVVIVDSIPALMPIKQIENSAEDVTVALQARLIDLFVRKSTQAMMDSRKAGFSPTLILINQWRNKIAFMGDNRNLPGGNALKFFASVSVELLCKETLGKDEHDVETVDYNDHTFKIKKNKVGVGIRTGEFQMVRNPSHRLGQGFIDDAKTVLTYAKKFGLFSGGGSAWRLEGVDHKFGRISEAVDYLYSDLDYFETLKNSCIAIQRDHSGLPTKNWYLHATDS